ncbi:MAG: ATP-dependent DNA helicase RecG [Verrucomicrobiota bacterium]
MPNAPVHPLQLPLTTLRGVGPERAAQLARLKLRTIEDLLLHRPNRYEDRRRWCRIADLKLGEPAIVHGKILALGIKTYRKGTKSVFEFILDDGTGRLYCRWWNLPYMQNYFQQGDEVVAFGRPKSLRPRTFDHPETEVIETGDERLIHLNRIVPVYPLTEGLPQRTLRALVWRALEQHEAHVTELFPQLNLPDLPTRANAVHMLHFPEELPDVDLARRRLALDEFIALQLQIQTRRRNLETNATALPCGGNNRLIKPFLAQLGFELTDAQTKVLREIRQNLRGEHPMRRLLQGDVGSGKTVVAACTALMALESGFNVALMAPTEILAEQHYRNFRQWLEPLGVRVELHTGSRKTAASGPALKFKQPDSAAGALFVGTHALIESGFATDNLGLVIIDEQHKFGVAQREKLVRKGRYPHLLVMTATPIPRTLGLTLYGDLDISIIDQMPAGRGRIKTHVRGADKLPKVWEFVRQKLGEGRQAYVVYPRVEDDEASDVKAVVTEREKLAKDLAPWKVGLLHGRLSADEKEGVMASFRRNELQVIVATSVIEVGVDVANASVMIIENAEQFGLAQLHQLRGRIGRGAHESHCILVANVKTAEAHKRLKVLAETTDGFRIAEADLELRGPGELLGREQSGLPPFRFGDLQSDRPLIERARELARQELDRIARGDHCASK